jgi:hypothetical protein
MPVNVSYAKRKAIEGDLFYVQDELSIDFRPDPDFNFTPVVGSRGNTSLLLDTLQIEVSAEYRTALFVWGYWPNINWTDGKVDPHIAEEGTLIFDDFLDLEIGISQELSLDNWITQYDKTTGWIRVSEKKPINEDLVRIATNTLLGISEGVLSSIMLKPDFR